MEQTSKRFKNAKNFKSILNNDYEPQKFIVSQMIPTGLNLFAGSPKIGKSWLALWLCDRVSKGEKIWEFESEQCRVLYIALEDTERRLHYRLNTITDVGSEYAYVTTSCESLSNGLLEQLDHFIKALPLTKLIVIDTLQLVRDGSENTSYSNDYMELKKYKSFADEKEIAIVLVHHLRKMFDNDPINMVSGSTGLIGAVDNIYVLEKEKRIENKARLHITGRDVVDKILSLEFDKYSNTWNFIDYINNDETPIDKLINNINILLQNKKRFEGSATELIEKIKEIDATFELSPNAITRIFNENSISLRKRHNIYYKTSRTSSKRLITLSRLKKNDNLL